MPEAAASSAPAASSNAPAAAPAPAAGKPAITLTVPKPAAAAPAAVDGKPAAGTPPAAGAAPASGDGKPAASAADGTPSDAGKGDNDLIKQLTKASAAERRANALVADLKTKLEAATGSATELQQQAALLAEIKKNPRKLLDLGLTWDAVLDAISGKEEAPEDPRLVAQAAEMKKLQERLDARDKAEKDAAEKAAKDAHEAQVAEARAGIEATIKEEGVKPDADGFPRWAIVSQDPASAQTAMDAVVGFIAENKLTVTDAEARELAIQARDQMEAHERKRAAPLLAAHVTRPVRTEQVLPSQPKTQDRAQLPPERISIDGANKAEKTDGPRTRARA